jgi:phosphoglycolate phosphatase
LRQFVIDALDHSAYLLLMRKITAILFDLDGTLADSFEDIADAVNHVLVSLGKSALSVATVKKYVGQGLKETLNGALHTDDDESINGYMDEFRAYYWDRCLDKTRFYPGVVEGLNKLNGYKKAVVTNKTVRFADKIIAGLDAKRYFDVVLGGDSFPALKPDPRALWTACEKLGAHPSEAVMVGDSVSDMKCAVDAGIVPIGVTYGQGTVEDIKGAGARYMLDSLADLSEIIDKIKNGD